MNQKDRRKYARGIVLSLIKQEIDAPSDITEDIQADLTWEEHEKIYDELEEIYEYLKCRWSKSAQK